jgi:hypothetical protein
VVLAGSFSFRASVASLRGVVDYGEVVLIVIL